uniref:alanine transaminase n=1 Tax=Aceria tosichella TaxID=561515 RepID=A0A6G1SN90_9ACAR
MLKFSKDILVQGKPLLHKQQQQQSRIGVSALQIATITTTPSRRKNLLNPDNINQNIRHLEYAVRGPLVMRSVQLKHELSEGKKKPFKSVISANIGDCQAMLQKPITFIRQVLACAADTRLLNSPDMPNDVKDKVRELLSYCDGGSVGAYTDSSGVVLIRQHVAKYIEERDGGLKSDYLNIFLAAGASQCIKSVLAFINHSRKPGKPVGVMIPIPQYPLYSATLCEYGMHQVNYYLNEEQSWSLSIDELKRAYNESANKADIKALVVINPGNPTGSVLNEKNIIEIIDFANEHDLMIIADEVYQHNVYDENSKFHSFKKVMLEKTNHRLELASMMSSSKGYMGECGLRGGYCELTNFSDDVRALLYKGQSSWLCSTVLGQITMDCVVDPPKPGQESYALFESEKNRVLTDLKRKAKLVTDTINSVEGVDANQVAGAMYAFPKLNLPAKAIQQAKSENYAPDAFYVREFLENYGVCVVPGTGFGQKPGSYHFRTTILPQPDVFEDMMDRFKRFHVEFLNKYS